MPTDASARGIVVLKNKRPAVTLNGRSANAFELISAPV